MMKARVWKISVDAWKDAAQVTAFLEHEISGLRDSDGNALPESAKQFFLDLVFQRIKPRRGRAFPKDEIRTMYESLLFLEQTADTDDKILDGSPSERVKTYLADRLKTSPATIDQIVNPRKSRPPRKPR